MPEFRLPSRFLLRGSVLLIVSLAVWWLVLVTPLVSLLRVSADIAFDLMPVGSAPTFSVTPAGDWNFRVPLHDLGAEYNALEFTLARDTLINFTFSLPIYWALALALPVSKPAIRTLLPAVILGSILIALVQVCSFLTFIEIATLNCIAQVHPDVGGFAKWLRDLSQYLAIYVVPFLAPLVVAASVHRELRAIFTGTRT